MSFSFVAVDVETAASRWDSICSIGLVRVSDGIISDEFYTLVNPECAFDAMNIHVNGIRPDMVIDAPTFGDLTDSILDFIGDDILVAHNISFDGSAISKSFARYGKKLSLTETYCTFKYAQELKKQELIYATKLGLSDLCAYYCITLKHHHNALDDARACAELLLAMAKDVKASSFDDLHNISRQSSKYISSKDKAPAYPFKSSPIDLWVLGEDYRKKGMYSEALELYNKSKNAGNDAPALYSSFAMIYHKMKDYNSEIAIINEFLSGKTYGREQEFIARKNKALAALLAQNETETKLRQKEKEKEERKAQKAIEKAQAKQPRIYSGRAILQMTDDGTIIKEHETIAAAVRDTKISSKSIRDAANGVQKHAGGFCWKYADQLE